MTIDDRARAAAAGLHAEVEASVGTDAALGAVLARAEGERGRRRAWFPAVAGMLLVAGVVAVTSSGGGGGDDIAIGDPDLALGSPLRLLAPDDGRDSIRLPVTVDPPVGLVDGQTVHVTAEGFEPGETVGIVQCAAEAGGEVRAGIDACRITPYVSVTADADGRIEGDYQVVRQLTVPIAGTVDCTAEAGRCLIGVGALANYDRSGGLGLEFAPDGPGADVPTVELAAADGLTDGQVVHIEGRGFTQPFVGLSVCSTDPVACWSTGDEAVNDAIPADGSFSSPSPVSLAVDDEGRIEGDVPIWRFLPGPDAGTYIDCALSTCQLRVTADPAPAPIELSFAGTDPAPRQPRVVVRPNEDLHAGSRVVIEGGAFPEGAVVVISFCATEPTGEAPLPPGVGGPPSTYCSYSTDGDDGTIEVDDDGIWAEEVTLGDFDDVQDCESSVTCQPLPLDESWVFTISASAQTDLGATGYVFRPPTYQPAPIEVDFSP